MTNKYAYKNLLHNNVKIRLKELATFEEGLNILLNNQILILKGLKRIVKEYRQKQRMILIHAERDQRLRK